MVNQDIFTDEYIN